MNNISLNDFIESELSWALRDTYDYINIRDIAEELANSLEVNGYCTNPYLELDKALVCPINKRREKYCSCTLCASHEFCTMLRKEGYV